MPYALENIGLVRNNKIVQDTPDTLDKLIEQGREAGSKYPLLVEQGDQGDPYHMYPIQTSFGAPVFQMKGDEYTTELGMAGPEGEAFAEYIKTSWAAVYLRSRNRRTPSRTTSSVVSTRRVKMVSPCLLFPR